VARAPAIRRRGSPGRRSAVEATGGPPAGLARPVSARPRGLGHWRGASLVGCGCVVAGRAVPRAPSVARPIRQLLSVRVGGGWGPLRGSWLPRGSEGTHRGPPPAFGREVPPRRGRRGSMGLIAPVFAPVLRAGPGTSPPTVPRCRLTAGDTVRHGPRSRPAPKCGWPDQVPAKSCRVRPREPGACQGALRMAAVTVIGTAGRPRTDGGRRGCPVPRPQDRSERRGSQLLGPGPPAPRTGYRASPPTHHPPTQGATGGQPPATRTHAQPPGTPQPKAPPRAG